MSLETIELLTKEHAADRAVLAERVQALHDEMTQSKRRKLPGIKSAASNARDSQLRLAAAIEAERSLFNQPRSRVFHGIKVGLQKAKGKLSFENAEKVVALIKKHFADQKDVLIATTEKPVKSALQQLPAADLKKLGCTLAGTGDQVLIQPINSEIDKLVEAMLESEDELEAEEA